MIWTSLKIRPTFIRYTYIGNLKGFNNKLNVDYNHKEKQHPTQKPLELIEHIIRTYSEFKDEKKITIYDPFSGSGSTLVVCRQLGLDYIGSELDEDYYKVILKRLSAVQGSLF
jgi:site-specific DNA-methyltransferase (adenine-specific)